jgi:hypothetical protein
MKRSYFSQIIPYLELNFDDFHGSQEEYLSCVPLLFGIVGMISCSLALIEALLHSSIFILFLLIAGAITGIMGFIGLKSIAKTRNPEVFYVRAGEIIAYINLGITLFV